MGSCRVPAKWMQMQAGSIATYLLASHLDLSKHSVHWVGSTSIPLEVVLRSRCRLCVELGRFRPHSRDRAEDLVSRRPFWSGPSLLHLGSNVEIRRRAINLVGSTSAPPLELCRNLFNERSCKLGQIRRSADNPEITPTYEQLGCYSAV